MNCSGSMRKEAWPFRKKFHAPSDERFAPVYSFYKNVWPEIRKRQLGLDTLPDDEQKVIDGIKNVPVILERGAKNQGMYGNWRYFPWLPLLGRTEDIRLKEDDPDVDRNLAHELRHYLARHIPSLTSDKETDRLNGVYGFKDSKSIYDWPVRMLMPWLTNEELYTTNTEHQYRIYKDLAGKLGGLPSGKEFLDYVDSANDKAFYDKERLKPVGYDGLPEHKPSYLKNMKKKCSESEWKDWLKRFKDFKGVIGGLASLDPNGAVNSQGGGATGSVKKAQDGEYASKGIGKARHVFANAIDWYLNKVNEAHLMPVNMATLLRDISAKQIGGDGFSPRPLTAKNFTDRELDAISRLVVHARDGKTVDYKTYYKDIGIPQRIAGKGFENYLSPINVVRTTLGQFGVSGDGDGRTIKDTYDFNREGKWNVFDHGDGTFSFRNWNFDGRPDRVPKTVLESILSRRRDGAYGLIRQNAANFGHTDDDPDSEKIKVEIPESDIDRRLGDNKGKYDINAPVSADEFKWRSAGAGVSLGAPAGAILGLLSGGIRLLDRKARKRWARTLLSHIAGGAALGAAAGGAATWLAAGKAIDKFNSNKMNEKQGSGGDDGNDAKDVKRKGGSGRKSRIREAVVRSLAYAIPLAALAGAGAYGARRLSGLRDMLLNPEQDIYSMRNERINFVDSPSKI